MTELSFDEMEFEVQFVERDVVLEIAAWFKSV